MQSVVKTVVCVSSICTLSMACANSGGHSPKAGSVLSPLSYNAIQIGGCTGGVPPGSQVGNVVRVFIPGSMASGSIQRQVYFAPLHDPTKPESNEDNYDVPGGSPDTSSEFGSAPFHVDLTTTGLDPTKFVMVRMIIQQPSSMSFYSEYPDSPTKIIDGIGISPDADQKRLCGAHVEANNRAKAVFYIPPVRPGSVTITPYSFGLNWPAWPDTPVIIDPKVKQPG